MHTGKEGEASQCNRQQKNKVKAEKIKSNRARNFQAKKTRVADVKFTAWKGRIPRHTQYPKVAKTLCLNLISVSCVILTPMKKAFLFYRVFQNFSRELK